MQTEKYKYDSAGETPELVWMLMSVKDLNRWLAVFTRKEDYEKCAEIRDELLRRKQMR